MNLHMRKVPINCNHCPLNVLALIDLFLLFAGFKYLGAPGLLEWVNTVIDLLTGLLFEKESSTYTYLLADQTTGEALLIDPVLETAERYSQIH